LRRLWSVPLVVVGALALLAVLVRAATTSARESLIPDRDAV
jgi:hypothetical protein